jgi:hypothetical protein
MAYDKWKLLFPPDSVVHRVFLKGEYSDCISFGSITKVISSRSHLLYATPAAQDIGASR